MHHQALQVPASLLVLGLALAPLEAHANGGCFCPQVYDPVECEDGSNYSNSCEARCDGKGELVVAGDFGQDNYDCDNLPPGHFFPELECALQMDEQARFAIDSDASFYRRDWSGLDHTNPGSGDFLISDGPIPVLTEVWCQDIEVEPGTGYEVSAWGLRLSAESPLPTLQLIIDGQAITDELDLGLQWSWLGTQWYAPAKGSSVVELCIMETTGSGQNGQGNDFGIDDISMHAIGAQCWPSGEL